MALIVRLCVAAMVAFLADGHLFQDDAGYLSLAERHADQSKTWDAASQTFWTVNLSFLAPIGFLFDVFGPYPVLAQSLQALAGAWTATCVTMLVRRHTRPAISVGAGMVAAFYPSQVLWSSLVLKDALVWMCLATIAVVIARWHENDNPVLFIRGAVGLLILLLYLSHLRAHTLVTTCFAIVIAVAFRPGPLRLLRTTVSVLLLLLVPLVAGVGISGNQLWRIGLFGMEEQRQAGAVGATTALVEIPAHTELAYCVARLSELESDPQAADNDLQAAREECEYWQKQAESVTPSTITDDLMYLPTGLRVMLLDPLPNQVGDNRNMVLAFAEHLIWYPILALCLIGIRSIRQESAELVFTALVAAGLVTMWALVEGNFGTAFRHRGEFMWAVIVLAGIGSEALARRRSSRMMGPEQLGLSGRSQPDAELA
jgi:hypothetical protein